MEVNHKSPCYGCEERHPRCHGTCGKYAAFLDKNRAFLAERMAKEDGFVHSAYTRAKKTQLLDLYAKKGFKRPNYQKTRYH